MMRDTAISVFKDAYAKTVKSEVSLDEYLIGIQSGEWEADVMAYRSGQIKKENVPAVTASGIFESGRNDKNLKQHSGFIAVDVDFKENPTVKDWEGLKQRIGADQYTFAVHKSVSGNGGFVIYVRIDPARHLDAFLGLEEYYLQQYSIIIDKSSKNVSRLRFVSYDPELIQNSKAKIFKEYLKPVKKEIKQFSAIVTDSDFDYIFEQHRNKGVNVTENYNDWINAGFALYDQFSQAGEAYFHQLSATSTKYNQQETAKMWQVISKRGKREGITIKTLLWMFKNAGLDIRTPQSKSAEVIAKNRRRSIGKNGGQKDAAAAKESYLKTCELEGIPETTAEQVWEQTATLTESELKTSKDDVIADLKYFLLQKPLKFNAITRNYELEGAALIDRDFNTLYVQACEQIESNLNRGLFNSILDSNIIPEYNPILDFFEANKSLNPAGNFEELIKCINTPMSKDFVRLMLKKWLLGIISSANGTYSILVLVLIGGQGKGKTEFFRNLLPEQLRNFYADDKLDNGKDSEILMTNKLIISDDEFGGKSKRDAKRLKELSSRQHFTIRRPYGRASEELQRLAVLCGTTNDKEVLNDFTGNRRIIPITITEIDLQRYNRIDKTALFMELYQEWRNNPEGFMLNAKDIEMLNEATIGNEQVTIEMELINKCFTPSDEFDERAEFIPYSDLIILLTNRFPEVKLNEVRIRQALKKFGFEQNIRKYAGKTTRGYFVLQ